MDAVLEGVKPSLGQLQHWTRIMGLAQQTILERAASLGSVQGSGGGPFAATMDRIAAIQAESTNKGVGNSAVSRRR